MAYETILYHVADCIGTITLNRPEKLNAWTHQMHLDLKHAMHEAGRVVHCARFHTQRGVT